MADKKFVNNVNEKNLVLVRAQQAVIAHDYTTAARLYKQLLKDEPSNVDYLKEIGSIYVKSGEDEKAIPYYEQIITFYPHYIDAMTALGAIYRRLKRYEDSINILQRAQDEGRQTGDINYNLGFTYREMGNYDDAIEAFNIVISLNPSDVLAHNHLGSIYLAKKNYQKAITSFKRGLQIDQNHPILNYNLARCYTEAKMYPEAIRCFQNALKARPGWVDAIKDFSKLLITCQQTKEASDLVRRSIELHPNDTKLLCTLGKIYLNQFDYEAAEKTFKRAKNVDDKDVEVLTGLAETLENEDRPEEALDNVIEAMDAAPENSEVKKQYVHTLLSAKEYDAAQSNIKELYENGGETDPQVLDLYSQYYICTGNEEKAQEMMRKIPAVSRSYKNHYLSAAKRYNQLGQNEKAESSAKDYVARDIKNPAGYNMLGRIYSDTGKLENAIEAYDKSRNLRQPNVLADKQVKKLNTRLASAAEPKLEEKLIPEQAAAQIIQSEAPQEQTAVDETKPLVEESEEFDFGTMGDNVPMGEALVEEEKSFFDQLDEATGKEEEPVVPEPEKTEENSEPEEPEISPEDFASIKNPYKDIEDDSLSPFDAFDGFSDNKKPGTDLDESGETGTGKTGTDLDDLDDSAGSSGSGAEEDNGASGGAGDVSENSDGNGLDDGGFGGSGSGSGSGSGNDSGNMPYADAAEKARDEYKPPYNPYDYANRAMESAFQAQQLASQAAQIEALKQQMENLKNNREYENSLFDKSSVAAAAAGPGAKNSAGYEDQQNMENAAADNSDFVGEETEEENIGGETTGTAGDGTELSGESTENNSGNGSGVNGAANGITDKTEGNSLLNAAEALLPAIEKILSDDDAALENAEEVELFKKLLSLSQYLPEEEKKEFLSGNIRLSMEYIIARMSGKPGLLKTAQSLKKTGILGQEEPVEKYENDSISNHEIRVVLKYMKKMTASLGDDNLAKAMCNKIDYILEQIEILESNAQVF